MSEAWSQGAIKSVQERVKARVAEAELRAGPAEAMEFIKIEISRLASLQNSEAELERLIYCISALYQHRRNDLLSRSEVTRIVEVARAILYSQQIKTRTSRLSFLHGDIHRALLQIQWKEGRFWRSAIELTRNRSIGDASETHSEEFDAMAMVIRLERMGMWDRALELAHSIDTTKLSDRNAANLMLRLLRIHRLRGDQDAFESCAELIRGRRMSDATSSELSFEQILMKCIGSGEFRELFNTVSKSRPHYQLGYVLEARLWLFSIKSREYLAEAPTVEQLSRRVEFRGEMTHHLLDVSRMIDKLLDSRTSNPVRLDTALEIAELSEAVPNIHEEFLLLTTVARWASRRNHRQLAGMVAERYRFKSKAFTGGRTDDALGVGKDLPALEFGHSSDEVESGT